MSFLEDVAIEVFAGYTCGEYQQIRIWLVVVAAVLIFTGIVVSHWYTRKNGIDINKFSGVAEMMRHVYSFENLRFSIFSILCSCCGALVAAIYLGMTLAAMGQGCVIAR